MRQAAGILFITKSKQVLLLQRGPSYPDHPSEWDFPGGTAEEGEMPLQTAERECVEEVGQLPEGKRLLHARRIAEDVDYTTFIQYIDEAFAPVLNDEHVAFQWATAAAWPSPLHPGVAVALAKLDWDEMQIAEAIRDGDLTSPQHFQNIWLFAMRVSGTGTAYRSKLDEVVYRAPELYLNEQFVKRCNGLPVIMEHPEKKMLDTAEFNDRIVGTIMLPYIQGDEVWGIARIYDAPTGQMMAENQLSTSPAVVFTDPSVNQILSIDDSSTLLIEGKPLLLDHLAICEVGVWDKGGPPVGIQNDNLATATEARADEGASMTEEEKKAAEAKADAGGDMRAAFDAYCAKMDSRLDAIEAKMDAHRKDDDDDDDDAKKDASEETEEEEGEEPKKVAADKKKGRKDAKHRKDAKKDDDDDAKKDDDDDDDSKKDDDDDARKDSAWASELADIRRRLPPELNAADAAAMADAQARADSVAAVYGDQAPRPMNGEDLLAYRKRLVAKYKHHSPEWKDADVAAIADSATLAVAEKQIFQSAIAAVKAPGALPPFQLREVKSEGPGGHKISEFYGDPRAWMAPFTLPRRVAKNGLEPQNAAAAHFTGQIGRA